MGTPTNSNCATAENANGVPCHSPGLPEQRDGYPGALPPQNTTPTGLSIEVSENSLTPASPSAPFALQTIYQETIAYAAQQHGSQKLIGDGTPYIVHVANVAMEVLFAAAHTPGFNTHFALQVALLHDVIEDTPTTETELAADFSAEVVAGVKALSKDYAVPRDVRMADSLRRIQAQPREVWAVKLADRITNLQRPPSQWSVEKIAEYKAEAIEIYDALKDGNDYLATRLKIEIEHYPRP